MAFSHVRRLNSLSHQKMGEGKKKQLKAWNKILKFKEGPFNCLSIFQVKSIYSLSWLHNEHFRGEGSFELEVLITFPLGL